MKRLGALVLAGALVMLASVATAQDRRITTTRLTDKLFLLSIDESTYSTNSLAFVGDDGVLLVDTHTRTDAPALKAVVDSFGRGTPRYIINTHRHIEHIGGNAIFGPSPVVIAHALLPVKLRSRSFLFEEFPPATFPDITVADSLTLFFNGERIRIIALPGSHDDNEIIVHFVDQGVVHLSSLVNGFNFPSVDADGDALRFPELAERAMALLPRDVRIISGHSPRGERRTGTWSDLQAYRDMMARCIEIVRNGLAQGRDVAALQRDSVLSQYASYARSYVSANDWIAELAARLQRPRDTRPTVFPPLYETWRSQGAAAAVARFSELRRDHAAEYLINDLDLLVIGIKLVSNDHPQDAVAFLEGSLREYPNGALNYYAHYQLAKAHRRLGNVDAARRACQRALELNPSYALATALLAELNRG
jgi:glyoxylase-like metal-dependent hydrolase (beta-lactamase superfamily II)